MKKHLKVIVPLLCFSLIFTASPVNAATVTIPDTSIMAENYLSTSAKLSISSGTATVTAQIVGKAGITTKTSIHAYLQQYKSGNWVTVEDWTSSGSTITRTISKTHAVTKGYKYRTKAVFKAYVGNNCETKTVLSSTVSY